MSLDAGKLDRRIEIQETTQTFDDLGQPVDSWSEVVTVWAAKEIKGGREYFGAAQVNAEVVARYRIRNRSGIEPKMRVVDGTDIFEIEAVLTVSQYQGELHLLVKHEDRQ